MNLFLHVLGSLALLYLVVFSFVAACAVWCGWRVRVHEAREEKAKAVRRARAARRYEVLVGQIGGGRWN